MNNVDFVILWVDGADEKWLKEKNKYSGKKTDYTNCASRYRDWGLLKYWFRAVEQYAPWVNNIFFVTYGHLPDFLDTTNPKVKIVNHKDFIPKEYLPTFSSHTIELNLHRIEGLSENFVYFNDDMYIMRPVKKEDYFKNGKPVSSYYETINLPRLTNNISKVSYNNVAILNDIFNKREVYKKNFFKYINFNNGFVHSIQSLLLYPYPIFSSFGIFHGSTSMVKSAYNFLWDNYYDFFNKTCLNKFRNYDTDLNQWIVRDYQNLTGNFYPRDYKFQKVINLCNENDLHQLEKLFNKKSTRELCINDALDDVENIDLYIEKVSSLFEDKFPKKSSFEK